MSADDLDDLLDQVRADQLEAAARLAQGVQEHEAWQALVHQLKLQAAALGQEAVQDALPFLLAALKVAIAAA